MRKTALHDCCKLTLLALLFCPALAPSAGVTSTLRINDSSDWWSILNETSSPEFPKPQHREPAASNFQILDVKLEEEFTELAAKLGQATVVERGDGAAGRSQVCYGSADDSEGIHVIFEHGEINYSFYLFAGGAKWTGNELCVKSKRIFKGLRTASGLGLGQSPDEMEAILGKANIRSERGLVYEFEVSKTTSANELQELRKRFPNQTDEHLRENFDKFTLSVHIEARFNAGRLNYLVVSKSEVN
jgi:hypothetical protein